MNIDYTLNTMNEERYADFIDGTSLTVSIILGVFLILFIMLFIYTIIDHRKVSRLLKNRINEPLQICYHFDTDSITAFYENTPSKIYNVQFSVFLNNLSSHDQERIRHWIINLRNEAIDTPTFIKTQLPNLSGGKKDHKSTGALIEHQGFNSTNSKMYMTLYYLHYVPIDQTKWKNNYNTVIRQLSNLIFGSKQHLGLYFINLSLVDDPSYVSDKRPVVHALILDRLYKRALSKNNTRIFELAPDMILIVEIPRNNDFNLKVNGLDWLNFVNGIIDTNFWSNQIKVSVGSLSSDSSKKGTRHLIDEGVKLAESAEDAPVGEEAFIMYKGNVDSQDSMDELYRQSLTKILDGKNISYQYQSIINPSSSRTIGYNTNLKVKNSYFKDFKEAKRYASRHEDGYELFVEYITKCCEAFEGVSLTSPRLFVNITIDELEYAVKAMPHIHKKDYYTIVFIIDEDDFEDEDVKLEEIISVIKSLKQQNHEIAIQLNDNELTLSFDIFRRFDYFIVPKVKRDSGSKNSGRIQIFYTKLLEKLIKYRKPIIALEVESWYNIELLVRLGIDYISSQEISPFSTTSKDIERRKLDRISKYAD